MKYIYQIFGNATRKIKNYFTGACKIKTHAHQAATTEPYL